AGNARMALHPFYVDWNCFKRMVELLPKVGVRHRRRIATFAACPASLLPAVTPLIASVNDILAVAVDRDFSGEVIRRDPPQSFQKRCHLHHIVRSAGFEPAAAGDFLAFIEGNEAPPARTGVGLACTVAIDLDSA